MVRKLMFLIIIFNIFFLVDNVSASSEINFHYNSDLARNNIFNDIQINFLNELSDYLDNNTEYKYYININKDYFVLMLFTNVSENYNPYIYSYFRNNYVSGLKFTFSDNTSDNIETLGTNYSYYQFNEKFSTYNYNYENFINSSLFNNVNFRNLPNGGDFPITDISYNSNNTDYLDDENLYIFYKTNMGNIQLKSRDTSYYKDINIITDYGTDKITIGDNFPSYYDLLNLKPTILFTNLTKKYDDDNNIIEEIAEYKINIYDTDRYSYQYKSEYWEEYTEMIYNLSGSNTLASSYNDTFYFKIIDKNTNEIVYETTFIFVNIKENTPYVKFYVNTPSSCVIDYEDKKRTICKKMHLQPKNLSTKHIAYWSSDNENWHELLSDESFLMNENGESVFVKIVDFTTNEIIYTNSFTLAGLDEEYISIGPYVTFKEEFNRDQRHLRVDTYFYNCEAKNYKFYYYIDNNENWTEIENLKHEMSFSVFQKYFYNNDNLKIQIRDISDNVIYANEYKVNFENYNDSYNSIFYKPIQMVKNKFPILEQSINIYNLYSSYNFQETKPNFPKISLSFMGIDKEFETIDLSFYEEYRDLIFSYSKLTMALLTLLKVVKNVKNSFGGGV